MAAHSSTIDTIADIDNSAPSERSRPFEKKFQFIVNAGKESRKLVRTHVMRDFRRQQRQQASQPENSEHRSPNSHPTWQWETGARRKSRSANVKQGKKPKRRSLGDGGSESSVTGSVPRNTKLVMRLQKRKGQKQGGLLPSCRSSVTFDDCEEVPRPQTFLGAGRVDPFTSHSLDLGHRQHDYFDQCMLSSIS